MPSFLPKKGKFAPSVMEFEATNHQQTSKPSRMEDPLIPQASKRVVPWHFKAADPKLEVYRAQRTTVADPAETG